MLTIHLYEDNRMVSEVRETETETETQWKRQPHFQF
jgi:hypothetical protein